MSNTIRGGRSIDLNVQAGESLKVSTISGTYTATVLAGAGKGTNLATDSSGGGTYGPYASAVTIRIKTSADGLADFDVAVTPVLNYYPNAFLGSDSDGNISSLVDGTGNPFSLDATSRVFSGPRRAAKGFSFHNLAAASFAVSGGSGGYESSPSFYAGIVPLTLTTDAGNTGNFATASWSTGAFTTDFLDDGGAFTLLVEVVSGISTNDKVTLIFSSNGATTRTMSCALTFNKNRGPFHFINMYPSTSDFIAVGGESFGNVMNYMAIKLDSGGGTAGGTIRVHGLFKYQKRTPTVTLQMDDGWLSEYTSTFQYMERHGLVGDIAVARGYVNGAFMSVGQINEMYSSGWDMVTHGDLNHSDGSLTTNAHLVAEIRRHKSFLDENGWTRASDHYIYPGGIINFSKDSKAALRTVGMKTGRTTITGYVFPTNHGVDDWYALNARVMSGTYTAASDLAMVDRAIESNSSVIFYGHKITKVPADGNEMAWSEFKTLVDGIAERVNTHKVRCVTQRQLYNAYSPIL